MESPAASPKRTPDGPLAKPDTSQVLLRLVERLDALDRLTTVLESSLSEMPGLMAAVVDVVDDQAAAADRAGIDLEERLRLVTRLAEIASRPGMVTLLERVAANAHTLGAAMDLVEQLPDTMSAAVDVMDDTFELLAGNGIDIENRLADALHLAERVTAPDTAAALKGVLATHAVEVVAMAGESLALCRERCLAADDPPRVSLFGAMRKLRTPDAQRTLAFLVEFAGFFGATISARHDQLLTTGKPSDQAQQ